MNVTATVLSAALLSLSLPAFADSVIYNNTTADSLISNGFTISSYSPEIYAVSDSFTVAAPTTLSAVDLPLWVKGGFVQSLNYAITTGPFSGRTLSSGTVHVTDGSTVATTYGYNVEADSFLLPGVSLAPGTYYLQLSGAISSNDTDVYWDESGGASMGFQANPDGSVHSMPSGTFELVGSVGSVAPSPTPEPSSLALLGTGLCGVATMLRRRLSK